MAIKNLKITPRSKIKSALRRLFLMSREHSFALKEQKYSCNICGIKQSKAKGREVKVNVHHRCGKIDNWNIIINEIYKYLLCNPKELQVLCEDCHKEKHNT